MVLPDEVFEAAVRAEVAENPKHVYQKPPNLRCLYVHEGKGSCLIGRALIRAGVPVGVVAALDDGVGSSEYTSAEDVLPSLGVSELVAVWANRAQVKQDAGWSDGAALAHADVMRPEWAE